MVVVGVADHEPSLDEHQTIGAGPNHDSDAGASVNTADAPDHMHYLFAVPVHVVYVPR